MSYAESDPPPSPNPLLKPANHELKDRLPYTNNHNRIPVIRSGL